MKLILLSIALILLICIIGVITSPKELQIGDKVKIKKKLRSMKMFFDKGHEFTISHIITPYSKDDDCINLKDDKGNELLFVPPNCLKLIK